MTETTDKSEKTLAAATAGAAVLLVAALVAAIVFGVGWGREAFGEKPRADARESVLSDARQAAINLNSFDSADLDRSFANIESSITGGLVDDLQASRDALTEQMTQTGARSTAEVVGAALTELNTDDGVATALVVLGSTTTWPDESSRKVRVTMRLTMEEGDDGVWRASQSVNLGNAAVLDETPAGEPVPEVSAGEPVPDAPAGVPAPDAPAGVPAPDAPAGVPAPDADGQ